MQSIECDADSVFSWPNVLTLFDLFRRVFNFTRRDSRKDATLNTRGRKTKTRVSRDFKNKNIPRVYFS